MELPIESITQQVVVNFASPFPTAVVGRASQRGRCLVNHAISAMYCTTYYVVLQWFIVLVCQASIVEPW